MTELSDDVVYNLQCFAILMRSKSQDTDKFRPFTGVLEHGAYVAAGVCYLGFFFWHGDEGKGKYVKIR